MMKTDLFFVSMIAYLKYYRVKDITKIDKEEVVTMAAFF